jgi:hypothetical protein
VREPRRRDRPLLAGAAGPLLAAAVALGAGAAAPLVAAGLSMPEPAAEASLGCGDLSFDRVRLSEAPDRATPPRPLAVVAIDHRRVAGRRSGTAEPSGSSGTWGGDVHALLTGPGAPAAPDCAGLRRTPALDRAAPRSGPKLHRLAPKTSPPRRPIA